MDNIEELAKAMGHVSKEEWDESRRGPWKTPQEYVELAQNKLPVARQNLEKMGKDIIDLKGEIGRMGQILKASEDSNAQAEQRGYERAKAEYERNVMALRDEYRVAAKEGDDGRMLNIERRMDNLKPPDPPARVPDKDNGGNQNNQNDPEFESFKIKNDWYGKDVEMTVYADTTLASFMGTHYRHLPRKDYFDKATELMKSKFPVKFSGPPPGPEGGGGEPPPKKTKKHTFDALPKEAQQNCDEMIKMGYLKSRERYLELYKWED